LIDNNPDLSADADTLVAEEGSQLIKDLLKDWLSKTDEMAVDDSDIIEGGDPAKQIAELRRCFEEFGPRLEANSWCRSLLASL
jgi:DNA mismatch repair protein MSH2